MKSKAVQKLSEKNRWNANSAQRLSTLLLFFLGFVYLTNGVATLISPNFHGDLATRWRERNYLSAGINPYDVSSQFKGMMPNASEAARIADHNLQNEPIIDPSGYPPWGLAASFLLIPPGSFQLAQIVFACFSLLALVLTCSYAFFLGRSYGTGAGLMLAATVFAMFGNAGTLRLGQYGLILNAFLVLSLLASAKRQMIGSGLAMAMAAIKPNFSVLQVALMIPRRQWVSFIMVAVVCAAASLVPWILTRIDPLEMIQQMFKQSEYVTKGDTGFLGLARTIMPYSRAAITLGLSGLFCTLLLGWKYRNASPLVATSIAAVIGRLCLYHRQYDNVMLMFPLMTLGLLALTIRKTWIWTVFIIYGLTLWVPLPYLAYRPIVIVVLSTVWIAGCVLICRNSRFIPL